MTLYNLYIFDRNGTCLHYYEWNRRKESQMSKDEEFKLMYGMLFSIKSFVSRMSPTDGKDGFLNFRTNKYKLHFYETPTGLKFVMNTDLSVGNMKETLSEIYKIYVEYAVKNPLCPLNEPVKDGLLASRLDDYVRKSPVFKSSFQNDRLQGGNI